MADSEVKTISRLAQWRVNAATASIHGSLTSKPFKMGYWNWKLSVEQKGSIRVRLFPELSSKEQLPIALFVLRLWSSKCSQISRKPIISPIYANQMWIDPFMWSTAEYYFRGDLVIDVEFLDLKIRPLSGGEPRSVWPLDRAPTPSPFPLRLLSRMLNEGIQSDVIINTANGGSLRAHKAILCASSPVFQSMFQHDLVEKESSTVCIDDMTLESCAAFLGYLYGTIEREDFWSHRMDLLAAANKYDLRELRDECEESLLEDINKGNAFERLEVASVYQLKKLKEGCSGYLFEFGKVYEVKEDAIRRFLKVADRELVLEVILRCCNR